MWQNTSIKSGSGKWDIKKKGVEVCLTNVEEAKMKKRHRIFITILFSMILMLVPISASAATKTTTGTINSASCVYAYGMGNGTATEAAKNYNYKMTVPLNSSGKIDTGKITDAYVKSNTSKSVKSNLTAFSCGTASVSGCSVKTKTSTKIVVEYTIAVAGPVNPTGSVVYPVGTVMLKITYAI
jgi:hypothetical protein